MDELRLLKIKRSRLLNKSVKTIEEFEMLQNELNKIELRIKEVELNN